MSLKYKLPDPPCISMEKHVLLEKLTLLGFYDGYLFRFRASEIPLLVFLIRFLDLVHSHSLFLSAVVPWATTWSSRDRACSNSSSSVIFLKQRHYLIYLHL